MTIAPKCYLIHDVTVYSQTVLLFRFNQLGVVVISGFRQLTAQSSTFWWNWDFDTGWQPKHFPVSGQNVKF